MFFSTLKVDGPLKKVMEFIGDSGLLDAAEIKTLKRIAEIIPNKPFHVANQISVDDWITMRKLLALEPAKAFPALDFARMLFLHPATAELFKYEEVGTKFVQGVLGFVGTSNVNTRLAV